MVNYCKCQLFHVINLLEYTCTNVHTSVVIVNYCTKCFSVCVSLAIFHIVQFTTIKLLHKIRDSIEMLVGDLNVNHI